MVSWCIGQQLKMSMIQVISHSASGGGIAVDRTPFYGIKLPSEVKKLIQLSKTVEHATMRKILKCSYTSCHVIVQLLYWTFCVGVLLYLERGEGEEDQLTAVQGPKCTQETTRVLFAGMLTLLSSALRTPGLKPEVRTYAHRKHHI